MKILISTYCLYFTLNCMKQHVTIARSFRLRIKTKEPFELNRKCYNVFLVT